ncbi:hypothetical protein MMC17_006414 [Xylographa soralifera]|nr:hypothetical protein [Xylographa soralifera]
MDATANQYDMYHKEHYGCSGSCIFGSRFRNERLSCPLPKWDPSSAFQRGIHESEQFNWVGDFEAYVNQSQEVQNNETMLRGAVYPEDHVLSFDQADLPVRDPGHREPREESFLLHEEDHIVDYHHSWRTGLPVFNDRSSATLDPPLDDHFSRQFFQQLPNRAKVPDLTDSIDHDNFSIDSPTLIQVNSTDGSPIHHNPSYFISNSSGSGSRDIQHGDYLKQQWRLLRVAAASLCRQRRRIRNSLRVLHRSQKALELERQEFRDVQKNNMRDPECDQSWYSINGRPGMDESDDAWRRDTKYFWKSRGKRTEQPGEEDLFYKASKSDDEPKGSSRRDYRHSSERHYFADRHGQTMPPPLTPDVVSQAKDNFANYKSAWTYLSERSQVTSPRIPYPTVTMQPGPLLEPFPSYVRLPHPPAFHPPAHVRIQFHALEFYVHPLGLQASLTFSPPLQSYDDPEQIPDAVVGVDGIDRLEFISLIELKYRMMEEVRKWHEDSLRRKGFAAVLDSKLAIRHDVDSEPKQGQHAECVMGNVYDLDEKLTERNIVQGVWAGVQLLKDLVTAETERRQSK